MGPIEAILGFFVFLALFMSFYTVEQQTAAIVQRFGKFVRIGTPGLNFKIPLLEWVADTVNLRIQELDVRVETKTMDNVFIQTVVSVQYHVLNENVFDAYYKLQDPQAQIRSYVFDVVRARVPAIKLDDVFLKKDEIADAVKRELQDTMDDFGYGIVKALVTDIDPDAKVKESMNAINAAERDRVAAEEQGEAEKILKVKRAEAEAESKRLQGEGIANQRKAIADGLRESVETIKSGLGSGVDAKEVLTILLATQYFDTLDSMGKNSNVNTIMLPHSPSGLNAIMDQLRETMVASNQVPKVDTSDEV